MDVDLEDRLVFGLTPQRLGYVAVAALAALACWHGLPVVGGPLALILVAGGALFGWGQWHGSGLDHWLVAAVTWVLRTRRLELDRWLLPSLLDRLGTALERLPRPRRPPIPEPTLPHILRPPPRVRRLRVVNGPDTEP